MEVRLATIFRLMMLLWQYRMVPFPCGAYRSHGHMDLREDGMLTVTLTLERFPSPSYVYFRTGTRRTHSMLKPKKLSHIRYMMI